MNVRKLCLCVETVLSGGKARTNKECFRLFVCCLPVHFKIEIADAQICSCSSVSGLQLEGPICQKYVKRFM